VHPPFFHRDRKASFMSTQQQFYLDRAEEARVVAAAATLDNVRERWLLSEATWISMAARSGRCDKMRAKLIADKAAERAALLAPSA
jgi:hypothetical protein